MGYLLRLEIEGKEVVKLFYSKPENGCYSDDTMLVSRSEYDEYYSKQPEGEFVFLEGWHDTSAEIHSKESSGIEITDTFFLDCIMQGCKIYYDVPTPFGII